MKLFLNFNEYAIFGQGEWEDVSAALLDAGFTRKSCVGKKGKAEQQTVSMKLKPIIGIDNVALRIISHHSNIRARLTLDDGTPYFIGTIRPLSSVDVDAMMNPISIQILDDSYYLDYYMTDQVSTLDRAMKICGSSSSDSLIHWLVSLCKAKDSATTVAQVFADSNILVDDAVDRTIDADGLVVKVGDTISKILDAVCYEYSLQYRFDEQGRMLVLPALPMDAAALDGVPELRDEDMLNSLKIDRADDVGKGAVVNYCKLQTGWCNVAEVNIYDPGIADEKTFARGYEWLNDGEVYPGAEAKRLHQLSATDLDKPSRQILWYDTNSVKVVTGFHSGTRCSDQGIGHFNLHSSIDGKLVYKFWLQATRYKTLIDRLYLSCRCHYIDTDSRIAARSAGRVLDPVKHDAEHIHSATGVDRLLRALVLRNESGAISYSFQSMPDERLLPGDILHLSSGAAGVSTYIRIVSVTDHGDSRSQPLVNAVAEGVQPLDDITIDPTQGVVDMIRRSALDYLKLSVSDDVVAQGESIEVTASGHAIDNLDAVLSWYVDGTLIPGLTEHVVSVPSTLLAVGKNTIRAVAAIDGVDFGDRPLDASISVSLAGSNGYSSAQIALYKRASSTPPAYDGGVLNFTFSTHVLAGNLGSWSRTIPSGSEPLYVIYASAFANAETDTIAVNEWTSPEILSENGTAGEKGLTVAIVSLYQRSATAPSKPSAAITYYFEAGTISGLTQGWSKSIPSGTLPIWIITATAVSRNDNDSIEPSEWSEPAVLAQNGEPGNGIRSTTVTYGVSESPSSMPFSWSSSIPAVPEGQYLWTRTITDYTDPAVADTVAYTYAKQGKAGEPGAAGKGISSITEHYLATDATEGITIASAGWTTVLQTMTPQRRRLWRYTRIAYTDGTSTDTAPCIIGVYGDPGADAVTVDIAGGVMQIPVDADGKAIASTSFNVIYKGWQGYVEKPCTASTGTLPQGMTATIGTDRVTLTVAEGETLGGGIIGTVDISITCCGLPFSRKATWAKALDAARVMQDMQAQAEEIEAVNSQITSLTSELATKAAQSDLSSLAEEVAGNAQEIEDNSAAISGLATRVSSAEGSISAHGTQITQNATAIQSKASQTEVDTVKSTVNSHGTQLTQQAGQISSLATRVTATENTNTSQQTAINQNAAAIQSKASQTEVSALAGRMSDAETSITQNANAITLKASSAEVDAIRSTAEQHAAQLDMQAGQISQKVTAIRSDGSVMADAELAVEADGGSTQIRLDADKVLINGSVKADKIDLDDLAAQDILLKENGALHSARYDRAGNIADPAIEKGTYIGADGQLKAFLAELESVIIKGKSIFQGEINSAVLSTSLEPKPGKPVTSIPFPAASACSYKCGVLREFLRTRLTANLYASLSGTSTYDGKTVVGLIRSESSNPVTFQNGTVAYNSGSFPKTLTFTTPAWPTHVQLNAAGLGYDYETTSGYWSSSSSSGSGNAVPSSGSPPSNPSDGDTYTTISNVEETGGSPRYTWTRTTHTYHETTTSHSGTYAVEIRLNGASVQSGSWIYAAPSSTVAMTYQKGSHADSDGSYTLKYDNYKRYGANVCVVYQGWTHEAIPAIGMSDKSVSLTISGATVRGGSGQSSWNNLTPYSQFRGLVQEGAAVSGAFSIHANNGISFTDESGTGITITGQGTAFANGAMLSFSDVAVSSGGNEWSTAGKWFSAWSVSFVPVSIAEGVHVSGLLPKPKQDSSVDKRCIGLESNKFDEIWATKVWGAVFNP